MSISALDRSRFEAIEAYVLGNMTADERMRFERELAADETLRAELELQRENMQAVELGGVTRMLNSIAAEETASDRSTPKGDWKQYLQYAAVVAIVLSGALWLLRPSANERLFAEHFTVDPGLPVAMSISSDPDFADAMVSYKEGKYAEARAKWTPMLQQEPLNDTLRYYIASAALAMEDHAAAIPLLETVVADGTSAFHAKAQWFLLLACLKTGEVERVKSIRLDGDSIYGERARAIQAQLD